MVVCGYFNQYFSFIVAIRFIRQLNTHLYVYVKVQKPEPLNRNEGKI
jgi:hypothetical protein